MYVLFYSFVIGFILNNLRKKCNHNQWHLSIFLHCCFTFVVNTSFRSAQSEGKALKRVQRVMPKSPRKKKALVRKLAVNMGITVIDSHTDARGRKPLSQCITDQVIQFYSRDDISRVAPGMKDCKKVDGKLVQKRHLYTNVGETYGLYMMEHGEQSPIGRSKFCQLRPANVLPLNDMPHNVCVCSVHENVLLCITALAKCSEANLPTSGRELVGKIVCDRSSLECMNMLDKKCSKCTSLPNFYEPLVRDLTQNVSWYQWGCVEKRIQKIKKSGSVSELLHCLVQQWNSFLTHCYTKDVQGAYFELSKLSVSEDEVVIQVDFSENYQTFHQDEIQSAHWSYSQITLFTCCVWTTEGVKSVCMVSDCLSHDKSAVHVFLTKLFQYVKAGNPKVTKIRTFSDGCAAQFKNRFLFSNLSWYKTNYELDNLEWNFFATSHGKGPVDGLGGSVKRVIRKKVLSRKSVVGNAAEFVNVYQVDSSQVKLVLVAVEEIEGMKSFLDQRWSLISTLKGTQQIHHLTAKGNYCVTHSRASQGMPTSTHCFVNIGPSSNIQENRILDSEVATTSSASANVKPGDYVIVEYQMKKSIKSFLGLIKVIEVLESEIQFFRRMKTTTGVFSLKDGDVNWVENDDIVKVLACPTVNNRAQYCFSEKLDFVE